MGINIPANSSHRIDFLNFVFLLFFFAKKGFFSSFLKANMNLTIFAGILLAVTMVTARRASLGDQTMQAAAGKADEPNEATREAAFGESLRDKIWEAKIGEGEAAADAEADELDEAERESIGQKMNKRMNVNQRPTGCQWAHNCKNPNRDQNELNCCYGSPPVFRDV